MKTTKTTKAILKTKKPAAHLVGDAAGVVTDVADVADVAMTGADNAPNAALVAAAATTAPPGASSPPSLATLPTSADPVPVAGPPSPPLGFVPAKLPRGTRMQRVQVTAAAKAGAEVASCANYTALFGGSVPAQAAVGNRLIAAGGWSQARASAEAWFKYTREQEYVAWQQATEVTDVLRTPFQCLLLQNPQVALTLPNLATFFGAPKARTKKALATKKRVASTKKKAAVTTATAVNPAVAAAPPVAAAAAGSPVTH